MGASVQPSKPIEMVLMEQANDAVKQGADPHAATEMLGTMIKHLRANPDVAQHANNAIAQGADPHAVSSKVWELAQSPGEFEQPGVMSRAGTMIKGAASQAFHHPLETLGSLAATPVKSAGTAVLAPGVGEARPDARLSKGGNSSGRAIDTTPYDAAHGGVTPSERTAAGIQTVANVALPSLVQGAGRGLINIGANRFVANAAAAGVGGAAGGAVYSPADPLAGAIAGGATAAALGAAAPPIASVVKGTASRTGSLLSRIASADDATAPAMASVTPGAAELAGDGRTTAPLQATGPATRLLLKRLDRAGVTPQNALDRLADVPADKPITVMEIAGDQSHPVRQLGKLVARTPSAGAAQLRASIADRAAPLPNAQRVLGDVADAMGVQRTNLVEHGQEMSGQRLAAAKPHYDVASEAEPVPLDLQASGDGPTLQDLLKRPSVKSAINFHNDVAAERGEAPLALPSGEPPAIPPGYSPEQWDAVQKAATAKGITLPGHGGAPDGIPLKTLQQIKFKLDDMLGFAKERGQLPDGTPATKTKLGAINDTRLALLDIMGQHSPDYAKGNEVWAGQSALQNAGKTGRAFLSSPIDELQADFGGMTAGEREQHNISALSGPIRDRIFKTSAVDRAKILSQPDITERLQAVVPTDRLPILQRNAGHEHQMALTNQQVTGGSDTFENATNAFDASSPATKALVTAATHGPSKAAAQLFKNVLESKMAARLQGVNEQTSNALSPMLTAGIRSRADATAMLQALDKEFQLAAKRRSTLPTSGAAAGSATGALVARRE